MRIVLNIIWLVLCGVWMAIAYAVAALICFALFFLVITIPFGIAAFRIAGYVLWPFGRSIERRPTAGIASLLGNILWIILLGWETASAYPVTGVLLCATIIGIPLGLANFSSSRSRSSRSGCVSCPATSGSGRNRPRSGQAVCMPAAWPRSSSATVTSRISYLRTLPVTVIGKSSQIRR